MHSDQPASNAWRDGTAEAAIAGDVSAYCTARLAHVAGTHGLCLDGLGLPAPAVPGVARWTVLHPDRDGLDWTGPLRAQLAALPLVDDAFCAVLACFNDPQAVVAAAELARVLAPHGTLLVAGFHPVSLWHRGVAPRRWERALRAAGLDVRLAVRCGAPWRRLRGVEGLPRWLVRLAGGAWVVEARRSVLASLPLRVQPGHRSLESATLLPGARRECA